MKSVKVEVMKCILKIIASYGLRGLKKKALIKGPIWKES